MRGGDVATSRSGGATQRHSLGTRQADGAPAAVEEDTSAMAKLLLMSLVAKSCKIVIGLLVGECLVLSARGRKANARIHHVCGPM